MAAAHVAVTLGTDRQRHEPAGLWGDSPSLSQSPGDFPAALRLRRCLTCTFTFAHGSTVALKTSIVGVTCVQVAPAQVKTTAKESSMTNSRPQTYAGIGARPADPGGPMPQIGWHKVHFVEAEQ